MKGEQFAKIFETENGQVLVIKNYDHDQEKYQLKYSMDICEMEISVAAGSTKQNPQEAKESVQQEFNECDLTKATQVSNFIISQAKQFTQ